MSYNCSAFDFDLIVCYVLLFIPFQMILVFSSKTMYFTDSVYIRGVSPEQAKFLPGNELLIGVGTKVTFWDQIELEEMRKDENLPQYGKNEQKN